MYKWQTMGERVGDIFITILESPLKPHTISGHEDTSFMEGHTHSHTHTKLITISRDRMTTREGKGRERESFTYYAASNNTPYMSTGSCTQAGKSLGSGFGTLHEVQISLHKIIIETTLHPFIK